MKTAGSASNGQTNNPLWLLAELTYRCPLQCLYCSNPIDYAKYQNELTTEEWVRVLREGRAMGATQLGFSGGEPLVRKDLVDLAREARKLGYYSNLITSGIGMDEPRIAALKERLQGSIISRARIRSRCSGGSPWWTTRGCFFTMSSTSALDFGVF